MKTKYIIFLYGLFIVSCNNYEKYNTDEKVIYNSLLSYSSNNNYQIDTIITHFPPSTFKNIAVNFKIYKVNFVDKTNPNMTKFWNKFSKGYYKTFIYEDDVTRDGIDAKLAECATPSISIPVEKPAAAAVVKIVTVITSPVDISVLMPVLE